MGAPDLIFELRRTGYLVRADGNYLKISPNDNTPPKLIEQLKQNKRELLAELHRESRQGKVTVMLQTDLNLNRVYAVDGECDPNQVIVTIATFTTVCHPSVATLFTFQTEDSWLNGD
jgi:hypothetical protein